ncbi:MAG: creatininase family protein [Albidovulum sp.]|nr:creatininase family protein [Albidovulum sp.]
MADKVKLGEHSWPEVEELLERDPVVIVPVGAFEQHGLHLPIMVDAHLVGVVAEAAAARTSNDGRRVVVTPVVWTGYSPHHLDFPGTVTLDDAIFSEVVGQVVRSLAAHQFRRILILNGHGGNANLLKNLVQSLRYEHGINAAFACYWDFALKELAEWRESKSGGIMHACEMETSLMLASRPDLPQMGRARDHFLERSKYFANDLLSGGPVSAAASFKELSPTGVIGAPTLATRERGKELMDAIVSAVAAFLEEFAEWPLPEARENST